MNTEKTFEGFADFMEALCDPAETEHEITIGTIYEGAVMQNMTIVAWLCRAIQQQFVRDAIDKGLAEGTLVATDEFRNGERVVVAKCPSGNVH